MSAGIMAAVALASLALAAPASAQEAAQAASPVSLDVRAAEASIDTESAAATGLYVAAVITHVGGLVAAPVVFMTGLAACDDPACAQAWDLGALSSLIMGGLGAVALGLAIGLDVDSGVRRRRLARRAIDLSLRIGPAGVALLGRF